MNLKEELQTLNNKLEKCRRKLSAAREREDKAIVMQAKQEIATITKKIAHTKAQQSRKLNEKGDGVRSLPFSRALSKKEQADMGKLKKSIKGLVVVHPMTALGREMGITEVTGFAPKEF